MLLLIEILEFVGTVMIALVALAVHRRIMQEKRIDKKVTKEITHELLFGEIGIVLLVLSFGLKVLVVY